MALPGETIGTGAPATCPDCQRPLITEVGMSAAGYYIGTWCDCGPYSRESGYFKTRELAQAALDTEYEPRTSEFKPGPITIEEIG